MQTFQFLCMSLIPTKREAVPFARNTKIFTFEGIFECSSVSAIFLHSCLMTGCSLKLLTLQPVLESARPLARVDCGTLPTMDSVSGGPGWGPGICIPNRFPDNDDATCLRPHLQKQFRNFGETILPSQL